MQRLGKQIRNLRMRLGLSQGKLAEMAQLSRGAVSDIEQGKENVTLDTLMRIAACLKAEPREMLLTAPTPARETADELPLSRQLH